MKKIKRKRSFYTCVISVFLWVGRAAGAEFSITDLGPVTEGLGINASGQIAGTYMSHAFLYDGTLHDLGTLGGGRSYGMGINASGHVTGMAQRVFDNGTDAQGFAPAYAFLYDGTMHDLGTLDGTSSVGQGINDHDQVTGYVESNYPYAAHAFFYDGTMHDIGTLGGDSSRGKAINNLGHIVGHSATSPSEDHAFVYDGTMHDLGTLGGRFSYGLGINDRDEIVGSSYLAGDNDIHAFYFDSTLHDLGTLGGTTSAAQSVNLNGQIVGDSTTNDGSFHAFMFESGSGMLDLNSLIDPAKGWTLTTANGINDAGQITGFGYVGDDVAHAFLLTPVPEPSGHVLALLAGAFSLAIIHISRRNG